MCAGGIAIQQREAMALLSAERAHPAEQRNLQPNKPLGPKTAAGGGEGAFTGIDLEGEQKSVFHPIFKKDTFCSAIKLGTGSVLFAQSRSYQR